MPNSIIVLGADHVSRCIHGMETRIVDHMEHLFSMMAHEESKHNSSSSRGSGHHSDIQCPERTILNTAHGSTLFMPSQVGSTMGCKVVSVRPQNASLGQQPTIPGFVMLLDSETGALRALMDASELTPLRTAAGACVAMRHMLSNQPTPSFVDDTVADGDETLLVFGAGQQAKWHIRLICAEQHRVRRVIICNRTRINADRLVEMLVEEQPLLEFHSARFVTMGMESDKSKRTIHVSVVDADDERAVDDAVSSAQIIVTATNAHSPVFRGSALRPGTHVSCVGSYKPHMQEVDTTTVQRSLCVADVAADVWRESGDFIIPLAQGLIDTRHIKASLSELVSGQESVRRSSNDITLFKSVGVSVQDTAVGQWIVDRARELSDIGTQIPFG